MSALLFAAFLAVPAAQANQPAPRALRPDRVAQRSFDLELPRTEAAGRPAKPDAADWRCPVPTQQDGEAARAIAEACRDFLEDEPDAYRVSVVAQLDDGSADLPPPVVTWIWVVDGDPVLALRDGQRIDDVREVTDWFKVIFMWERHDFAGGTYSMDPAFPFPDQVDLLMPDGVNKLRHSIRIHPVDRD